MTITDIAPGQQVHETREAWLEAAVEAVTPLFEELGERVPSVRVSCGWPSSGATTEKNRTIGECWKTFTADDKTSQIFISPVLHNEYDVLGVLIHELIHAWDDGESGHKGRKATKNKPREGFRGLAAALGLEGKMTATTVGEDLAVKLHPIYRLLGKYPHAALRPAGQIKKQSTRMLKVECPQDGYTLRTTQKWLDMGLPTCPCGTEMVQA